VAAIRAAWRIGLKMGDGVAQAGNRPSMGGSISVADALPSCPLLSEIKISVSQPVELCDRPIHFFLSSSIKPGMGNSGCSPGIIRLRGSLGQIDGHPAKNVVDNRAALRISGFLVKPEGSKR